MSKPVLFKDLPDLALIQIRGLIDYKVVPYSATTIWRFVKKGQFPAPIKVSDGVTAWRVGDIRKYLLAISNRPQDDSPKVAERKKRMGRPRKEAVKRSLSLEDAGQQIQAMTQDRSTLLAINPYRDHVIEEVAQAILKMEGFGQDTLNSFAIYIRSLK